MGAELRLDLYEFSDSEAALELEQRSAQGRSFRLRFDRPYFHRRAENFDDWRLVAARIDDRLVGVAGGAVKSVQFRGRPTRAIYLFDVRVAPEARRSKIAQRLLGSLTDWARDRTEIGYGYVVDDNEASIQLGKEWMGTGLSPACRYLVYPVYKSTRPTVAARRAEPASVHASFVQSQGPFDLYSDPSPAFASEALVGSWTYERGPSRAACSAWSNEAIFAEVVEGVPPPLAALGALQRRWPFGRIAGPPIPRRGERLRSWYLFDFDASDDEAAVALVETVASEARERGIAFCYVIHRPSQACVPALRRRFPKLVAPVIPYSIIAATIDFQPWCFAAPYIDIRDV